MNANKTFVLAILACLLATAPSFCRAAVFERDWKVPGDGLLTYDDVNQREWLDLSETILFDAGGVDGVLAELEPGGRFEGFTLAKADEVFALAESGGIDTTTLDIEINQAQASSLIVLLADTIESGERSLGLVDEFTTPSAMFPDQLVVNLFVSPGEELAGANTFAFASMSSDRPLHIVGMFVYRPVPEASTPILLIVGLYTFIGSRSRTYRQVESRSVGR